jgi:hypothetical protein
MKYAIKTGLGTAILALPAFVDSTRPLFVQYHGEWALLSFFVGELQVPLLHIYVLLTWPAVMSRTIGAVHTFPLYAVVAIADLFSDQFPWLSSSSRDLVSSTLKTLRDSHHVISSSFQIRCRDRVS